MCELGCQIFGRPSPSFSLLRYAKVTARWSRERANRAWFNILREICYARCGAPRGLLGEPGRAGILDQGAPVRSGHMMLSRGGPAAGHHRAFQRTIVLLQLFEIVFSIASILHRQVNAITSS